MKNILLLVDEQDKHDQLLKMVLNISRQCIANIILCRPMKEHVPQEFVKAGNDHQILVDDHDDPYLDEVAALLGITGTECDFMPGVSSIKLDKLNAPAIREMVIKQRIWLIVAMKRVMGPSTAKMLLNTILTCENINCPVLFFPEQITCSYFNRLAYMTDIRYCDNGVIKFLKAFNAPIFVTHVTAPGLTDMCERYAQDLLHNYIAVFSNYPKLFLRNMRGGGLNDSIDAEYNTLGIKLIALVNKKHGTLERLFDNGAAKSRNYEQLPLMLFPYLDWFHDSSFYA